MPLGGLWFGELRLDTLDRLRKLAGVDTQVGCCPGGGLAGEALRTHHRANATHGMSTGGGELRLEGGCFPKFEIADDSSPC